MGGILGPFCNDDQDLDDFDVGWEAEYADRLAALDPERIPGHQYATEREYRAYLDEVCPLAASNLAPAGDPCHHDVALRALRDIAECGGIAADIAKDALKRIEDRKEV